MKKFYVNKWGQLAQGRDPENKTWTSSWSARPIFVVMIALVIFAIFVYKLIRFYY